MSAVSALPDDYAALLEDLLRLDVVKQLAIAFLMCLLNCRYPSELLRQLVEPFLIGILCHAVIHVRPLVILALSCRSQVLSCVTEKSKMLEPQLRMLLLVVSGLLEQCRNLLIACLLCDRSKVCILVSRHGFASQRFLKVLLCLGACVRILCHLLFPFLFLYTGSAGFLLQRVHICCDFILACTKTGCKHFFSNYYYFY